MKSYIQGTFIGGVFVLSLIILMSFQNNSELLKRYEKEIIELESLLKSAKIDAEMDKKSKQELEDWLQKPKPGKYLMVTDGDRVYLLDTQTGAYYANKGILLGSQGLWDTKPITPAFGTRIEK